MLTDGGQTMERETKEWGLIRSWQATIREGRNTRLAANSSKKMAENNVKMQSSETFSVRNFRQRDKTKNRVN